MPRAHHRPRHRIELHLDTLARFFNTMDPSPFYRRDLDPEAEEYILSWAQEYALREPVTLVLHLDQGGEAADTRANVTEAVHNHFANQARLARLEFHRLMRQGWRSLLIGLGVLALAVIAAGLLRRIGGSPASLLRESLLIGGWVALWRPMQIYLYDWWPLQRRQRIFAKLASMPVEIRTSAVRPAPQAPALPADEG